MKKWQEKFKCTLYSGGYYKYDSVLLSLEVAYNVVFILKADTLTRLEDL